MMDSLKKVELGKLINRFRIKVEDRHYQIEVYNKEVQDENNMIYSVVVNGEVFKVEVENMGLEDKDQGEESESKSKSSQSAPPEVKAPPAREVVPEATAVPQASTIQPTPPPAAMGGSTVVAPMPGKILSIKVNVGDKVEAGQAVLVLEAMKMENILNAPIEGTVREIKVSPGTNTNLGDVLIIIQKR